MSLIRNLFFALFIVNFTSSFWTLASDEKDHVPIKPNASKQQISQEIQQEIVKNQKKLRKLSHSPTSPFKQVLSPVKTGIVQNYEMNEAMNVKQTPTDVRMDQNGLANQILPLKKRKIVHEISQSNDSFSDRKPLVITLSKDPNISDDEFVAKRKKLSDELNTKLSEENLENNDDLISNTSLEHWLQPQQPVENDTEILSNKHEIGEENDQIEQDPVNIIHSMPSNAMEASDNIQPINVVKNNIQNIADSSINKVPMHFANDQDVQRESVPIVTDNDKDIVHKINSSDPNTQLNHPIIQHHTSSTEVSRTRSDVKPNTHSHRASMDGSITSKYIFDPHIGLGHRNKQISGSGGQDSAQMPQNYPIVKTIIFEGFQAIGLRAKNIENLFLPQRVVRTASDLIERISYVKNYVENTPQNALIATLRIRLNMRGIDVKIVAEIELESAHFGGQLVENMYRNQRTNEQATVIQVQQNSELKMLFFFNRLFEKLIFILEDDDGHPNYDLLYWLKFMANSISQKMDQVALVYECQKPLNWVIKMKHLEEDIGMANLAILMILPKNDLQRINLFKLQPLMVVNLFHLIDQNQKQKEFVAKCHNVWTNPWGSQDQKYMERMRMLTGRNNSEAIAKSLARMVVRHVNELTQLQQFKHHPPGSMSIHLCVFRELLARLASTVYDDILLPNLVKSRENGIEFLKNALSLMTKYQK